MLLTFLFEFLVCLYVFVYDKGIVTESFVCIYCFETINFTGALEIVVTVCLSICLNSINTYYIFGYHRMSVFQRHQVPFLNEKYKSCPEICFKSVKLTHSHLDLTEIQPPIPQYLI